MAFADTRYQATGGFFHRALASVVARVTAHYEARATRLALSKLSDHELDDIGLNRADLVHMNFGDLASR